MRVCLHSLGFILDFITWFRLLDMGKLMNRHHVLIDAKLMIGVVNWVIDPILV